MTFFDRWLLVACVVFGVQGLGWVVLGSFDPFGIWDAALASAFYEGATPESVVRFRRFILGPFGATLAGYFTALALIVWFPFQRREPWSFVAVAAAVSVWFAVDSVASIAHGAVFNVWIVNVPCFTLLAIPLVALRSRFDFGAGR